MSDYDRWNVYAASARIMTKDGVVFRESWTVLEHCPYRAKRVLEEDLKYRHNNPKIWGISLTRVGQSRARNVFISGLTRLC